MNNLDRSLFPLFLLYLTFGLMAYVFQTPHFEGFDETAHYSLIRQYAARPMVYLKPQFIDQVITQYPGPKPYQTGSHVALPNYSYQDYIEETSSNNNSKIIEYLNDDISAAHKPDLSVENWQTQHPPLYYFLAGLALKISGVNGMGAQIILLRLISVFLVVCGCLITSFIFRNKLRSNATILVPAALLYTLCFPMFFAEFARIGNDALVFFLFAILLNCFDGFYSDGLRGGARIYLTGLVLAIGLLTKLLFFPIAIVFIAFLFIYSARLYGFSSALLNVVKCVIPILLLFSWWPIYMFFYHGTLTGSFESSQLLLQGGMLLGLEKNFDALHLIRSMIAPIASFIWGGTWSIVRLPYLFYIPSLGLMLTLLFCFLLRKRMDEPFYGFNAYLELSAALLVLFYLGIFWHILVMIALDGSGSTPGWYLHVIFPVTFLLFFNFSVILTKCTRLVYFTTFFVFLFLSVSIFVSQAMVFLGYAVKGHDKFIHVIIGDLAKANFYDRLTSLQIVSYPVLSVLLFSLSIVAATFIILIVNNKVWRKKLHDFA